MKNIMTKPDVWRNKESTTLENGNAKDMSTKAGKRKVHYTHITAPTQFVETNGISLAYRRFGK